MEWLRITDLLDLGEIEAAIEQGFVRRQVHPDLPLSILNYTERCQYERAWTDVTRQCRGLIVSDDGWILGRPFGKFFNYGEHPEGALDLTAPAEVTDKMDGSLGILYPMPDGWAVATRGSFTSDQALHATQVFRSRYAGFTPPDGMTVLFEIIYPANRVVVDYGVMDDLVLLGGVHIKTGESIGPGHVPLWDGPVAGEMAARTLAGALALPPRAGREGVVVRMGDGIMVKIKQGDYVALHRLVTGLNARIVWERMGAGESAADICAALPDEFHAWVSEVASELLTTQRQIIADATAEHQRITASLAPGWTRKDYALAAVSSPLKPWLFNLLDGKDPSEGIWRTLRPSGERSLVAHGEDVA